MNSLQQIISLLMSPNITLFKVILIKKYYPYLKQRDLSMVVGSLIFECEEDLK